MDHYIILSINEIIEVELFDVHAHVSEFDVKDNSIYM